MDKNPRDVHPFMNGSNWLDAIILGATTLLGLIGWLFIYAISRPKVFLVLLVIEGLILAGFLFSLVWSLIRPRRYST